MTFSKRLAFAAAAALMSALAAAPASAVTANYFCDAGNENSNYGAKVNAKGNSKGKSNDSGGKYFGFTGDSKRACGLTNNYSGDDVAEALGLLSVTLEQDSDVISFIDRPVEGETAWSVEWVGDIYEYAVVTLKHGNGVAFFLLDLLSGEWSTGNNGTKNTNDLSHARVYYGGDKIDPVPLPAALPLIVSAFGLLWWRSRRTV